ncbi:MAG: DUF2157 domain-containing protein [Terracidiphilus sp.]|nr:DUF2157 domain-containing protein [Terracidiphilus sp.]
MNDIESQLTRWQSAGVLDADTAARIRALESKSAGQSPVPSTSPAGLKWLVVTGLILGAILLACGVVLFVSSHWDQLGPGERYLLVIAMVAVFHIAGGLTRASFEGFSTALHAVGTISTGAAIALVGQIFNIQEHWPAAVLLWAVAAFAGWALLRDQAQQTLALLLLPAWIFSELAFRMGDHIACAIYVGRLIFVWAVLYITFFIGSRRKAAQGILFAVSVIGAVTGIVLMLAGWASHSADQSFIPFGTRVWAWVAIAAVPLLIATFHGHKGLVPIAAAIVFAVALPWCYRNVAQHYSYPDGTKWTSTYTEPNLLSHALVAAFAVFLCWWGVRLLSRALVNLGILGFAGAVGWFYFSNIYDDHERALGLIGLGVLFLAGGWALEKMRRRILARMAQTPHPAAAATEIGGAQ